MVEAIDIPDRRAPAFPDKPYSAYCKVCWNAVYVLWVDKKHDMDGKCPNGCTDPDKCPDARAAHFNKSQFARAKRECEKASVKGGDDE